MTRIPFGIARLDSLIGGGAPAGSVVLVSGESGAGAREFLHTSAVMNGLQQNDPDLFDLHYGELDPEASPPNRIHYVSFTADETELQDEIAFTLEDELVEAGLGVVNFQDFSPSYFQLSPVPREWYTGKHRELTDIGRETNRQNVLSAFADYLDENASGSLVVVDSLTDLVVARESTYTVSDIALTLKGLRRVSRDWDGLILLHLTRDAVTDTQLGALMTSVDGTMQFTWEIGGNKRERTMFVSEFRGVLSQLEDEDIVQFETEIHDGGFDISNVRKIR